ncbi:hypothetical protein [Sandarakinorhabdus sp.]|uniref:hypothetical protein n=1 Tax=Sandarakinorhabdus sp. TaxID=1916663 RepID=UPI00286DCCDC|nr:hypothetical protein [Sandarakinorhabdus sp.]
MPYNILGRLTLGRLTLAAAMAVALAGCSGGYGRMAYNSDYDRYYGDNRGYSSVPYGYSGSNFGWWNGYYYPGTGAYVYNRRGNQRAWSRSQRRYWENRDAHRGDHGNRPGMHRDRRN